MKRADAVVTSVHVKISAVVAGMVKHPVENYINAAFFRFLDKLRQIGFVAQKLVYFKIIARIVSVVGIRFENGIKIYCRNA